MAEETKKVISLEELKELSRGEIISIPGFEPGTEINVRVRKQDLLAIAKLSKTDFVSNSLQKTVVDMFENEDVTMDDITEEAMKDLAEDPMDGQNKIMGLLDTVCESSLVEPTYQAFVSTYPLTMEQKMAIFNYVTGDALGLINFRTNTSSDAESDSK